ncbi:MAG: hypothetical protein AAGJ89_16045 [Pseudomonadota bacterium]
MRRAANHVRGCGQFWAGWQSEGAELMFKRVIKTKFWISLVGLMLVVPLAGFITVTSTTQAEANALKVKQFKKYRPYKFKKHFRQRNHDQFEYSPSAKFQFKKLKKFK